MLTMNKLTFLEELDHLLKSLSKVERHQNLDYYAEMIDDRMEDGLCEEEAVAALGNPADIAAQILGEVPPKKVRRYPVWAIILIVLGSPLWIALLLAAAAVVLSIVLAVSAVYLSVFLSLWAALATLYIADLALLLGFLAAVGGGIFYLVQGVSTPSLLFFGTGLACAGCTVLLFFLCNWLSRLLWQLTKWSTLKIAGIFRRKGGKK